MSKERFCPINSLVTGFREGHSHICLRDCCEWWNRQRNACALVAISEELQDLRAEAKRKRMAEAAKEE